MSRILPLALMTLPLAAIAGDLNYPPTKTIEQVDDYHGTKVADPYRWLEDDVRTNEDVAEWVAAQNKVTFGFLESIPERDVIKKRLTELWDYEKYSSPFKSGGRYYFFKNDGLQNQSVLHVQESLDDEPKVLIDPNTWSKDGTIALGGMAFADDGKYLCYSVSEAGSDWNTWRVMDIASQSILPEEMKWSKFSGAAWTIDGKGFFYCRYPKPQEGDAFQSLNLNQKVYYHRAGTSQDEDVLVYERPDQPEWGFGVDVSEDGRYLVITAWKGTAEKYRVFYKDLHEPFGLPVALVDEFENEYSFLGNDGTVFYFRTDLDAPKKRIVLIDTRLATSENFKEHVVEVLPETPDVLDSVSFVGNMFVCSYLHDAKSQVKLFTPDGKFVREVTFEGIGTASGFDGKRTDVETFYSFSSFATPPSIYRYDLLTGENELIRRADVDVNPDDYEVKQVFFESKDGTKVPMFITHKKGVKLDGSNPTLLYGYGGFSIPLTPGFSISRLQWMKMGGVFVMANLRGGGEYGEEWHLAGTKLDKQNVFDDFIAAAEWLIDNRYTNPDKLAIQGGSNGGLLVGAAMTQRPDLFAAALPAVGVMDMLRFHKFTAGRFWVDDYGSADTPAEFEALYAYSPLHNLKAGVDYPATLITTADTDDRVVPGHSFKFAARLQETHAGDDPVLIRIETRAGHGAGKPTEKIIEEVADQWAFLVEVLDMDVPY
ncbi:MAG: prolyl oligopeptidase family serine peptidase [Planctomycetaceae bacterium]